MSATLLFNARDNGYDDDDAATKAMCKFKSEADGKWPEQETSVLTYDQLDHGKMKS